MTREPPPTITTLYRGRREPTRIPAAAAHMSPEQAALELADRVRWAEWNTKKYRSSIAGIFKRLVAGRGPA